MDPLVFISHKHSDREIAETLGRFVRNRSAGQVRVHLSSSPDFEGPRFNAPLNAELKQALGASDLVILVYTTEAEDWSYCMWECGVATNPHDDTPTAVVAVQCTEAEPKPFSDQLRVDARKLDSVQGFVKALLTSTDFFANQDGPVTGFAAEGSEVKEFAAELHAKLADVLPKGDGVDESTRTAPFFRVHLNDSAAEELRAAYLANDSEQCLKILQSEARITDNVGAGDLFGIRLTSESTLGDVLADWRETAGDNQEARWFSALAEQIEAALVGRTRHVKWAPYRTAQGRSDVPFVAASRQVADGSEFDVYVLPISPRPVPVSEKMIPADEAYLKDRAVEPFDGVPLTKLVKEMQTRAKSRIPLLDDGRAHAVIHEATINKFIVGQLGTDRDVASLTLEDLLAVHAGDLQSSYAEVAPDATVEDAMKEMAAIQGCQDVLVVENDVVVGWLPNVMFIES